MTEAKYTPAPWKITNHSSAYMDGIIICDEDCSTEICGVWEKDNALLIAAAPELLEALENLLYSRALGNQDDVDKAVKQAHEVLLKAKGIEE